MQGRSLVVGRLKIPANDKDEGRCCLLLKSVVDGLQTDEDGNRNENSRCANAIDVMEPSSNNDGTKE